MTTPLHYDDDQLMILDDAWVTPGKQWPGGQFDRATNAPSVLYSVIKSISREHPQFLHAAPVQYSHTVVRAGARR